jgi:hypothetical protein
MIVNVSNTDVLRCCYTAAIAFEWHRGREPQISERRLSEGDTQILGDGRSIRGCVADDRPTGRANSLSNRPGSP